MTVVDIMVVYSSLLSCYWTTGILWLVKSLLQVGCMYLQWLCSGGPVTNLE